MTDILMLKTPGGQLAPLDADDTEKLKKIKAGHVVECTVVQKRNPLFHRKFFALLGVGFDAFTETARPLYYHGEAVRPEMERFRKDITILAGYYKPVYSIKGELRLEAESISFANMDEERFEKLFSAIIDVLLERILGAQGFTAESLREHVDRVIAFT